MQIGSWRGQKICHLQCAFLRRQLLLSSYFCRNLFLPMILMKMVAVKIVRAFLRVHPIHHSNTEAEKWFHKKLSSLPVWWISPFLLVAFVWNFSSICWAFFVCVWGLSPTFCIRRLSQANLVNMRPSSCHQTLGHGQLHILGLDIATQLRNCAIENATPLTFFTPVLLMIMNLIIIIVLVSVMMVVILRRSAAGTFIKGLEARGDLFLEGLSEMGWNAITRLALERRLSRPLLRLFSSSNCSQNQS